MLRVVETRPRGKQEPHILQVSNVYADSMTTKAVSSSPAIVVASLPRLLCLNDQQCLQIFYKAFYRKQLANGSTAIVVASLPRLFCLND